MPSAAVGTSEAAGASTETRLSGGNSAQPAALIGYVADVVDASAAKGQPTADYVSVGAPQPSVRNQGNAVTAGDGTGGKGAGVAGHAQESPSEPASSAATSTISLEEDANMPGAARSLEVDKQHSSGRKSASSWLPSSSAVPPLTSGKSPIKVERDQEATAPAEITAEADGGTNNGEVDREWAETANPEVSAAYGVPDTALPGLARGSSKVAPATDDAIPSVQRAAVAGVEKGSVAPATLESAGRGLRSMDCDVDTNAPPASSVGAGAGNDAVLIATNSTTLTPAADADNGSATSGANNKHAVSSTINTAPVVECKVATKDGDGAHAKVHRAGTKKGPPPTAEAQSAGASTTKQASKKSGRRSVEKEEKPPPSGPDVFPPALECVIDTGRQEKGRATTDMSEQLNEQQRHLTRDQPDELDGGGGGGGSSGDGGSAIDRLYGDHCLEREATARSFFNEHDTLRRRFQMAVDLVELDKAVESEGLELRNGCRTVQTIKMRLKSRWREGTVLGTILSDSSSSSGGYGRSGGKGVGLSRCTSKEIQQATLRWQGQIKAVIRDHKELLAEVLGRQRLEAGALQMAQEMEVPKGKAPPLIVRFAFPRMFEEVRVHAKAIGHGREGCVCGFWLVWLFCAVRLHNHTVFFLSMKAQSKTVGDTIHQHAVGWPAWLSLTFRAEEQF